MTCVTLVGVLGGESAAVPQSSCFKPSISTPARLQSLDSVHSVLRRSAGFRARAAPGAQPRIALRGLSYLSRSLRFAERVSPSVVQIFVTGLRARRRRADAGRAGVERSSGSGVIVDADGYIVTNAHVVEGATRIEVVLPLAATGGAPGLDPEAARPRGRRAGRRVDRETDIAVSRSSHAGCRPCRSATPTRCGRASWSSPSAARSASRTRSPWAS